VSPSIRVCFIFIVIFVLRILGLMLIIPVAALYVPHYHGYEPVYLGWVLGIYGFMQALCQLPLGMLSDRIGRKSVVLLGLVLLVLGSVVAYQATSVYSLLAGRAIQGMGAIGSTIMAGLADQTAPRNRTMVMGGLGACIGLSFLGSLVLGPILAEWVGMSGIFFLVAAIGVVAAILVWFLVPPMRPTQRLSYQPSIWLPIIQQPAVWRVLVGIWAIHTLYTGLFSVLPSHLVHQLALPLSEHWTFYATAIGGSLLLAVPAIGAVDRWAAGRWYVPAFTGILAVGLCMLLSLSAQYATWLVGMALFFAGFNFFESYLPAFISKQAPDGARGMVMGVFSSCQFFGIFSGGVLAALSHAIPGPYGFPGLMLLVVLLWGGVGACLPVSADTKSAL
jgi:MFS family permease